MGRTNPSFPGAMPPLARHLLLLLAWVLVLAAPALSQVRPGLAHRVDPAAGEGFEHAPAAPRLAAGSTANVATHDPDVDGALIGALVGAGSMAALVGVACGGNLCELGFAGGILVGSVAGLVVGGAVDAADPLQPADGAPRTARTAPADTAVRARADTMPAPTDTLPAVAPAGPGEEAAPAGRSDGRRSDLIGAALGAGLGYGFSSVVACSANGFCPAFHPGYLLGAAIGAILGAGIGSGLGQVEPDPTPE